MARSKEKITIKWNKKDHDWEFKYPEWENRNPRILGINLTYMITDFEKNREEKLIDLISQAGFDPDTFSISVCAKLKTE